MASNSQHCVLPTGLARFLLKPKDISRIGSNLLEGTASELLNRLSLDDLEAAANANTVEIVQLLLERKTDPNTPETITPQAASATIMQRQFAPFQLEAPTPISIPSS